MPTFAIKKFAGEAPRIQPRQLPDGMAQTALNTKLWSTLAPFRDTLPIETKAAANLAIDTIYPFGQTVGGQILLNQPFAGVPMGGSTMGGAPPVDFIPLPARGSFIWAHWPLDVDIARGAIPGDQSERTYYTGDGVPKFSTLQSAYQITPGGVTPAASYPLGIAAPTTIPTCTPATDIVGGAGVAEVRSYVHTLVSIFGEESAPSMPLVISDPLMKPGAAVTIHNLAQAGLPSHITVRRIYRTNTAANGVAEFQFVAEIPVAQASYTDNVLTAALGELLPTTGWLPPNVRMRGIKALPNGGMAGFFDNVVCLCEPWKPYAWPIRNQYSTEYQIIALGVYGSNVVVLTTGNPYLLSGIDPSGMSMSKLPIQQACVSKRSVVNMGYGVAYASPDGIFVIGANGARNATENYFTRDEWQALKPSSMHAYMLDGRYFCFWNNGVTRGGFIFDPSSQTDGLVSIDIYASAGYADLTTDALYLLVGTQIVKWDSATTTKVMRWRSQIFVAQMPVNLGYGQVRAAAYPVTLRVLADGVLKHTQTVVDGEVFVLPSGFLARDWEFEIEGNTEVYSAVISDIVEGIQNV